MDFITGDVGVKQLSNLPKSICVSSMVAHNGKILLCGGNGNSDKCLQLDHGTWKEHSTLNVERVAHSAATTQAATFIFGGFFSKTYEYLPNDSTEWIMGKTEIPGDFEDGYAIAVKSGQEIWLIGGDGTEKRVLSFNVNDHTFQVLPFQLDVERVGHRCAIIPNTNKIIITGGCSDSSYLDSAEILDIQDGSITMASPMNSKRYGHGMGVVTINGEEKLAVFGGYDGNNYFDSVELYNTKTEKWDTTDIKLKYAISRFRFLSVKLADVVSHL